MTSLIGLIGVDAHAARDLVVGVKLAMEWPPGRVGPLPKIKTSRFYPLYFQEAPHEPTLDPLEPGMGP